MVVWFFVHGSTVGETTGKRVGLMPFVVFVVAVLRRFLFFLPLLFRCIPSAAAVRPAAKEAAVFYLFGFPYGILLHQFLLFLPLGRVFFRFSFPRVACGWFLVSRLLLVGRLQQKAAASPAAWPSWPVLLSLSLVLSRSSVVFSFPSSASLLQGGVIGVREGSKTLYSKIHLASLSYFLYTGGTSTSER